MSSYPSLPLAPVLSLNQGNTVSWEDHRFIVHVNDASFELGALPLFPWNLYSELAIGISPAFDTPVELYPQMVDLANGEFYMRNLVQRCIRASENWKPLLQERVNNGECSISLVFGES